jgi:DNA-binding NarL/FixJ family response regulator
MPLRVVHADDHPLVRSGCRMILERAGFDVVGEAANGAEAVRLTTLHRPDVVVLDVNMPGMDGLDAARAILDALPQTLVVCWTMCIDEHRVVEALDIGVRGYVVKTHATRDLPNAIRSVAAGRIYVSASARGSVVDRYLVRVEASTPSAH